jgi:hypothetical protein
VLTDPVPVIPRPDVPADLQTALVRAMAKAPDDRWPTPADLGRALQAVGRDAGWPVTPLPVGEVSDAGRRAGFDLPAPDGDLTTPGLRGGQRPERTQAARISVVAGEPPLLSAATSAEETRSWARHSPAPPCRRSPPSRRPTAGDGWAARGGLALVGVVVAVLLTAGSPGPKVGPNTPRLQPASTVLAARLAPRQVEIINEPPTTVTIHWVDPSNGLYPYVVKVSNGSVQTAAGHTQTVVAGLDPTRGYWFGVGAFYGGGRPGGQRAAGVRAGRHVKPPRCTWWATPRSLIRRGLSNQGASGTAQQ